MSFMSLPIIPHSQHIFTNEGWYGNWSLHFLCAYFNGLFCFPKAVYFYSSHRTAYLLFEDSAEGTRGYYKCYLKCQYMYEILAVSSSVSLLNSIRFSVHWRKINVCEAGWYFEFYTRNIYCWNVPRRFPSVKITHHPAVRGWRMQRK